MRGIVTLREHSLDERRLLLVLRQLFRARVGIVTKSHAAGESQMALVQSGVSLGDTGAMTPQAPVL